MFRHNSNWHWVSCVIWGERRIFFHVVSLKCYYVLILPLPSIYRYCIKPRNTCAFLSFEDFMLGVCELCCLLLVMIQEILFYKNFFLNFLNYSLTERKFFYEFWFYYSSTLIKHKASLITKGSWCATPGLFTLPQMFAPVYCQREQYCTGQIPAFMGDYSCASVLWCHLSSHPLEKCWLCERLPEIQFLVLYIWHFWILHRLLWVTWKWIEGESGI